MWLQQSKQKPMSGIFGMFSSLGASSKFQKYRLQFTNKNDQEAPNEHALQKLMCTFEGKDDQTRAQIGYATIIRKINNSDSNTSWVYLLKNLIILDTALEQKLFVEELAQLELPILVDFKDQDKKYIQFYFDGVVRKYFHLIKLRAECLTRKRSLFNIDRYQRQEFLEHMSSADCSWLIEMSQKLFQSTLELIDYKRYEITQFKIIQWLFLQLLYKLINFYSTELLAITRMLNFLQNQSEKEILEFKKHVQTFNKNANSIISFAEQFKWIKGFETINYKEFDPSKNEIVSYIQQALKHKKNQEDELKVKVEQIQTDQKITVNRKPRQSHEYDSIIPVSRLEFVEERKTKKKTFQNYINCFSEQWPPKDIITTDLIQLMKEQEGDAQFLDQLPILDRATTLSSFNLNAGESTQESLCYKKLPADGGPFRNIYSQLPSQWVN